MNFISLVLYGGVNLAMVLVHLARKSRIYEFPFWAGAIALGWFFPQAIGGYLNVRVYPASAFANSMNFATLCTVALWLAHHYAMTKPNGGKSWLDVSFDGRKLKTAGAVLCALGFFFMWQLMTLPEEMFANTQWTGAPVKYLFLASIFKFGFVVLWILYLKQGRWLNMGILVFFIPSLMLMLNAAVLRGRRSAMMELVSYLVIPLWFVRRKMLPRWMLVTGLCFGLILVNAIVTYRNIVNNSDKALSEKLSEISKANYTSTTKQVVDKGGAEFNNYLYYRLIYEEESQFDYGISHWNEFIFNFVPAQIIGRSLKNALMFPLFYPENRARDRYGHSFKVGSTITGYCDAFGSFGWLGFIKFGLAGFIMGSLYRRAMNGHFLGQMLYAYMLAPAMHMISHGTNKILVSSWAYFFMLCLPILFLAMERGRPADEIASEWHVE